MTVLTSWNDVVATEEFIEDLELLTKAVTRAIGNEIIIGSNSPFIWTVAYLAAFLRYYIRHLPDMKDLNQTPFLAEMAAEIGFTVPLSDTFPLVQLLRENKRWNGHRGTPVLYNFIGMLFNSRLSINYPHDLIFTLDTERSCLDGAASPGGSILSFDQSDLAYIRDGIYWSQFTYVINILDAQDLTEIGDFFALLESVHPAGTQEFRNWFFSWISTTVETSEIVIGGGMLYESGFVNEFGYPVLDDGFQLDTDGSDGLNDGCFLDNLGHDPAWFLATVKEWQNYQHDSIYSRMWTDSTDETGVGEGLMHIFIPGKPWATFSRFIGQPDGTYVHVYPDNDAACYENVTTNVGLLDYTISELAAFSIRELKYAALNKDQQNMRGMWTPEMLNCDFALIE